MKLRSARSSRWIIGLALFALACGPSVENTAGPPNIVLVISDDQSFRDYGFMGSDIALTPNLDALAQSGTVFTHGFTTASACRPSLRSLLTGLEPQRLSALEDDLRRRGKRFADIAAITQVDTLPRVLAERGYVSFQGGKHWEGHFALAGFDVGTATGFNKANIKYWGVLRELAGGDSNELGRSTMAPVLDFMTEHRDEPFLVWFAPMLPHTPHDPPAADLDLYKDSGLTRGERNYFGNVSRLDARVGELLDHLAALGLRERTLVVFLGDNGWDQRAAGERPDPHLGGSHGKFSVYENGFRTPVVVSWPGVLPAGRRDGTLVSALDLFPTLLDYAGVTDPPPGRTGVSLRGVLEGTGSIGREYLIAGMERLRDQADGSSGGGASSVREEAGFFLRAPGWRYVWIPERGIEELYAIDEDPWERRNLADEQPERVARYRAEVEVWRARVRVLPPLRHYVPGRFPGKAQSSSSM